jgi:hypothetical protein
MQPTVIWKISCALSGIFAICESESNGSKTVLENCYEHIRDTSTSSGSVGGASSVGPQHMKWAASDVDRPQTNCLGGYHDTAEQD